MLANFVLRAAAGLVAGLLCAAASAETLYKLIDKNGKVTYSETRPDKFDGQVIPINVDSKANTMDAPKSRRNGESSKEETDNEKIIRRRTVTIFDRLKQARDGADAACKAYEAARDNPGDQDLDWIAVGATPQPSAPPAKPPDKPTPVGPTQQPPTQTALQDPPKPSTLQDPPKPSTFQDPPKQPTFTDPFKPPVAGQPPPPASPPAGRRTGARPVPTDEYRARLAELEKSCAEAKEKLDKVEKETR